MSSTQTQAARPLMFAYTRVSTEEQADSRNGLEAQVEAINVEAARRDWDVEHFGDEGASGKYINAGLREALQLLASGQGDGLIVAKMDRLARSIINAADIIERANEQGWNLVVLDLGVDLTTDCRRGDGAHARGVRPVRAPPNQRAHQSRPGGPQAAR